MRALRKDVDDLDTRLKTLTKKHNTLAGSYYADCEPAEPDDRRVEAPAADTDARPIQSAPFPEDDFAELLERKRSDRSALRMSNG